MKGENKENNKSKLHIEVIMRINNDKSNNNKYCNKLNNPIKAFNNYNVNRKQKLQ